MEMGIAGIIKFLAALLFVLGLMGGLALALKKLGVNQPGFAGRGNKRLKLVEALPLDARRKALILQCDEAQHLVIIGPQGETLVQANITQRNVSHENDIKDAA